MVIKTASPGIVVNEVDLTRGTSDAITTNIGAFVGPFERGPIGELVLINTEADLQRIFGDPNDSNYEYWWTVSNFLEYGGVCYVVRCDDSVGDSSGTFLQTMRNASDDVTGDTDIYVKNQVDFEENWFQTDSLPGKFAAQTPGTWGNGLAVAVIDHGADYQFNLKGTEIVVEATGVSVADNTEFASSLDSGTVVGKYIKLAAEDNGTGIVAGSRVVEYDGVGGAVPSGAQGFVISIDNGYYQILLTSTEDFQVGNTLSADTGTTETTNITANYPEGSFELYGYSTRADVINTIWIPNTYTLDEGINFGWTATPTSNQKVTSGGAADSGDTYVWSVNNQLWVNLYSPSVNDLVTDGTNVFKLEASGDWYTAQIAFAGLPWYRFAGRPASSQNALDLGASNDELNIIIYDADGSFTGTKGNTLETYFGVSKLTGARTQEGDDNYYINAINNRSSYIYANQTLDATVDEINTGRAAVGSAIGENVAAEYITVESYLMAGGVDNYTASLGELQAAYNLLVNENVSNLDYILQGPGMSNLSDSVSKANFIISICEERKDCMAFLSPPRFTVIGKDSVSVTASIVEWADELSSSSYVVFDSGYKYTYDRFNDQYRYVPLNGDIAGLMVNTALTAEPWFSPAGLSRGQVRNVVKLPYNPSKKQRDQLYTNRVNPVVTFPGEGTILFGDKTALGYSSAFDRINVRKLFLVIEREIAEISRTTLFEFNDDVTRSLFKNNVNPFLRDVQSKRGMYDFLVVCDTTNNTAEVIDRNEFIADIYVKPSKSVNFISLNFIATKTGVSFDESVALFRGN